MNPDKIYDSSEEDVQGLIQMTKAFSNYIDEYNLF
jgi:hypothetical protein